MPEELFNRSSNLRSKVAIYYMGRADSLRYAVSIFKATTNDPLNTSLLVKDAEVLEAKAMEAESYFMENNGQEMQIDESIPTLEPKPKL